MSNDLDALADDLAEFDLYAGLFTDLASRGLGKGFAELLRAARQTPLSRTRRLAALDQQHPIVTPDDDADPDHGLAGIAPAHGVPPSRNKVSTAE